MVERMEEKGPATGSAEPVQKTPRVDAGSQKKSCLGGLFDEILQQHEPKSSHTSMSATVEVHTYLSEPTVSRSSNPLECWRTSRTQLPLLATLAASFLSAPCSSTESERLFSAASLIVNEQRNRILAERAEMLLFLKKNLKLVLK